MRVAEFCLRFAWFAVAVIMSTAILGYWVKGLPANLALPVVVIVPVLAAAEAARYIFRKIL